MEIKKLSVKSIKQAQSEWSKEVGFQFEHCALYLLGSLGYKTDIFTVEDSDSLKFFLYKRENEIGIFSPFYISNKIFRELEEKTGRVKRIRNFSTEWLKINENFLKNWHISKRSEEQAIYDLGFLNKLEGSEMKNLRRTKRRLLDSKLLSFKKLEEKNFSDIYFVLDKWKEIQSDKYFKDNTEKDVSIAKAFINNSWIKGISEVGYVKNIPVSFFVAEYIGERAVSLVVKGINKNPGLNGVSDATYLRMWELLKEKGINFVNDGSLGTEVGTRFHKLSFKPINLAESLEALYE